MKCKFERRGDCCNIGSPWYLCKCEQPCDTIVPITNADRIRAMSDAELAKVFTATVANGCPLQMDWDCAKDKNGWDACDACWCKWLKQPAEGVKSDE